MKEEKPYIERDISWLHFNGRVLQEAEDPTVPLYERIKFLAIYSSNLDEFFRVRVASIRSFRKLKKATRKEMAIKPRKLLKKIRNIVHEQQNHFGQIFREQIIPELATHGIHLVREHEFSVEQRDFATAYFLDHLAENLEYKVIREDEMPFLKNKSLYLIMPGTGTEDLLIVKIPDQDRFIELPGKEGAHFIAFIDDIIRVGMPELPVGEQTDKAYAVKLSRDAEMYIDDEFEGDLLEKIKKGLKERDIGLPTRFLYDPTMPDDLFNRIKKIFGLTKNDLVPGARYHNFNDFFSFPDPLGDPSLHDSPLPPLAHPELENADSMLSAMAERDFLLHYPYHTFQYTSQLIEEAANDPEVTFIKVTLYRVAARSAIAESLLKALQNGKKVFAFIEVKARFDEESNLYWGEKLKEAGANVKYSFPGIKVHSKLLLVGRIEGGSLRHYAYIATGNFNEKTAKLYSDFALFTAKDSIADEAAQVFRMLEGNVLLPKVKNLFVAPHTLRDGFTQCIEQEIAHAKQGKPAWMILKLNSLEDEEMMSKLIEASQAGVQIQMIIRGICRLVPDVEGYTSNIKITSIVDRFLEHARVYIFANGGEEKIYLASADWMERNLNRRVEVAVPVQDKHLQGIIRQVIDFQLQDNVKARIIDGEQSNRYVERKEGEPAVRAQIATYRYFENMLEHPVI